jgi:hypothetical protein
VAVASDDSPLKFEIIDAPTGALVEWAWVVSDWKAAHYWTPDDAEVVQSYIPANARIYVPRQQAESGYLTVLVEGQPFLWINAGYVEWKHAKDAPSNAYEAESGCLRVALSRQHQFGERNAKGEPDYGPLCPRCFLHHHGDCDR